MSRFSLSPGNSSLRLPEMPSAPSRPKDLTWDLNGAQKMLDRRHSSVSAYPPHGDPIKHNDDKAPRTPKESLSLEDRILQLERELAQLASTTEAARTLSDYDHEQISEVDLARYNPTNEVTRITSDDWHDKRGARFAKPETSVLTVCNTSRYWAGRVSLSASNNSNREIGKTGSVTGEVLLAEITVERPYRLAICGYDLLKALEILFGMRLTLSNNVWIWPFKQIITYEDHIRQRLIAEQNFVCEMDKDHFNQGRNLSNGTINSILENARTDHGSNGAGLLEHSESTEEDRRYASAVRLKSQLECLVQFMDEDMKELLSVKQRLSEGTLQNIAFEYLWLLFKPGDLIYTGSTQRRAYRVLHVTGGRAILDIGEQAPLNRRNSMQPTRSWEQHEDQDLPFSHAKNTPFVIDAFYIDFDGDGFGPVPRRFVIQEFEGEHPIDTLPAFPAQFEKNGSETEKMLAQRGRRFMEMATVAHKRYSGLSAREPSVADWQEEVNSDVIIDFAEAIKKFRKDDPSWEVGINCGVVENASRPDPRETNEVKPCSTKGCTLCKQSDINDDSIHDLERRFDFVENTHLLRYRVLGKDDLSAEQIILLPPRVYGYSLLDRFWYPLNIDNVEDIQTNAHDSFDDLVLPGDHKRIMQALVKHHSRGPRPTSGKSKSSSGFSADLVRGKGRGLIILLHGVPGVGKTSTAECVAAQTKRPLFPITCGDIGTTPSEVETRLEQYFDLAHKWGCVLLLDEADVYLATREKGGDLQRNSLVSVFLRVLEYYSGILILTTNRVGEFDEAFKSRIHISLYYPKLDQTSTRKIWKMNLSRIERGDLDIDVDSKSIMQFAEDRWKLNKNKPSRRWNGRQIKNAFQTAVALATWDFHGEEEEKRPPRPRLTDRHFSIVSQTSAHFDDYLSATYQIDEGDTYAVLAEREGLRDDKVPKLNWTDYDGRSNRLDSSRAYSGSSRRPHGRSHRSKSRRSEDDDDDDDDSSMSRSGESDQQTGSSEIDDFERQKLEQRLRKMRRRKSSTRRNGRGTDKAEDGRSSRRKGKKESNHLSLPPEVKSKRGAATTDDESEEKSD